MTSVREQLEAAQARRRRAIDAYTAPWQPGEWEREASAMVRVLDAECGALRTARRELERAHTDAERRFVLVEDRALGRALNPLGLFLAVLASPAIALFAAWLMVLSSPRFLAWSFTALAAAEAWAWVRRKRRVAAAQRVMATESLYAPPSAAESTTTKYAPAPGLSIDALATPPSATAQDSSMPDGPHSDFRT